jgi:serine/threonine protein kinase
MSSCPSPKQLRDFLFSRLGPAEGRFVSDHIDACESCQSMLDGLADDPDLGGWLSHCASFQVEPADDPQLTALIGRLVARRVPGNGHRLATPLPFLAPPLVAGDIGSLGEYRVQAILGYGGTAVVFKARDSQERVIALKVLRPEFGDSANRARFVRGARAAIPLQHDHIVRVFAVEDPLEAAPYLVMEYLDGPTLRDRIQAEQSLAPREAARIVREAAEGLAAAHAAGVVHRDVNPNNILLGQPRDRAKLADFGLARSVQLPDSITREWDAVGTPEYMSPEQVLRPDRLDERADIYGLGATLYEALTGEIPFRGTLPGMLRQLLEDDPTPPHRLNGSVPPALETICLKCLEKEPRLRYRSAGELAADLGRFLDGEPIRARPVGFLGRGWRWCRRKPKLAAALGALVVVTAVGFATTTWQWTRTLAQRSIAEQHLGRLIQTHERTTELIKRPELQTRALAPLRQDALTAVMEGLLDLEREAGDNPRLGPVLVLALTRVASIENELRPKDQALATIRKAIGRGEAYLKRDPTSADGREALMKALHWSLVIETDHARCIAAQHRADALIESLVRDKPNGTLEYRQYQCLNNYNFAKRFLGEGQRQEAIVLLNATRDLGEAVVGAGWQDASMLRGLGRVYSYLGEIEGQDGHHGASQAFYLRSNDLFRTVYRREPQNLEALMEYCVSCEQVQNMYANQNKLAEATRFAKEACRALEEASRHEGWQDYEALGIHRRLVRAYYMLEMQHGQNQQTYESSDAARFREELVHFEAACRRAQEIAEALRPIAGQDADLEYFNCISCFNVYRILAFRDKQNPEAREWLVRARKRLPKDIERTPDEARRSHYQEIRETYNQATKG